MAGDALPFERDLADLHKLYEKAQRDLAKQILHAVEHEKLITAQQRRMQYVRLLALLDEVGAKTDARAARIVAQAHEQSAALATQQTGALVGAPSLEAGSFSGIQTDAVKALEDAMLGRLDESRRTVGRHVHDLYRRAGLRAVHRATLGVDGSAREAKRNLMADLRRDPRVQRLLRESNGATGFVDKAGRRWRLDSYAQMVVRTTTREAAVQGAVDGMLASGVNLARISTHGSSCDICQPYEGRLVSLDGQASSYRGEAVMDTSALPPFHPNCRHSISPVVSAVQATRDRMRREGLLA